MYQLRMCVCLLERQWLKQVHFFSPFSCYQGNAECTVQDSAIGVFLLLSCCHPSGVTLVLTGSGGCCSSRRPVWSFAFLPLDRILPQELRLCVIVHNWVTPSYERVWGIKVVVGQIATLSKTGNF